MKIDMVRMAAHISIAAAAAVSLAAARAQPAPDLGRLTVPASRLPADCRLRTASPKPQAPAGSPVVVTIVSETAADPMPSNPWYGQDRHVAAAIRRIIDGSPKELDGPPLDADAAKAFALRWAENVIEAYGATYRSGDGRSVAVYAIRFNDEQLARPLPPPGTTPVVRGTSTRIVSGSTVVLVVGGPRSNCFDSIIHHIRSLD